MGEIYEYAVILLPNLWSLGAGGSVVAVAEGYAWVAKWLRSRQSTWTLPKLKQKHIVIAGIAAYFIAAGFLAWKNEHDKYQGMVNTNQTLTNENNQLRNTRKRELLEVLVVYLGTGRRLETGMLNSLQLHEMDKTNIKNWQEEVEVVIAGSLYKDRVALLKDSTGVPPTKPPQSYQPGFFTIWKSVNTMNYRIKELIDYIRSHDD